MPRTNHLLSPLAPGEARRVTVKAMLCLCARCGHTWISLTELASPAPERCASCKSPGWRSARGTLKRGRKPAA